MGTRSWGFREPASEWLYPTEMRGNLFQTPATPEGILFYLDGGDKTKPSEEVVGGDLTPQSAIHEIVLMLESDPLFELKFCVRQQSKTGSCYPGGGIDGAQRLN